MEKNFRVYAYFGIMSLVMMVPMVYLALTSTFGFELFAESLVLNAFISVLTCVFLFGFFMLGKKSDNKLLKYSALALFILQTINTIRYIAQMISFAFFSDSIVSVILIGQSYLISTPLFILFSFASIAFGISLIKIKSEYGNVALAAGILNIAVGIFYSTILLIYIAGLFAIPATILGIILLWKARA